MRPHHFVARAAGGALATVFGTIAAVRPKPLHPRGLTYDAVVHRSGAPEPRGVPWLDEPGLDTGSVRLSRAAGMPSGFPDVLGLALTFPGADGEHHDLLLATTGLAAWSRFVLLPRIDPLRVGYTSLLPYQTPLGPIVLAAMPCTLQGPSAGPVFGLHVATPLGAWQRFATLELSVRGGDEPIAFDPVRNVLPGLAWPEAVAELREPAYAAARRRRAAISGADAVRARQRSARPSGVARPDRA